MILKLLPNVRITCSSKLMILTHIILTRAIQRIPRARKTWNQINIWIWNRTSTRLKTKNQSISSLPLKITLKQSIGRRRSSRSQGLSTWETSGTSSLLWWTSHKPSRESATTRITSENCGRNVSNWQILVLVLIRKLTRLGLNWTLNTMYSIRNIQKRCKSTTISSLHTVSRFETARRSSKSIRTCWTNWKTSRSTKIRQMIELRTRSRRTKPPLGMISSRPRMRSQIKLKIWREPMRPTSTRITSNRMRPRYHLRQRYQHLEKKLHWVKNKRLKISGILSNKLPTRCIQTMMAYTRSMMRSWRRSRMSVLSISPNTRSIWSITRRLLRTLRDSRTNGFKCS